MTANFNEETDEDLMLSCKEGNIDAFDILFDKYKKAIMSFAYRFLGNYEDAKDIFQKTFLNVFKNANSYRYPAKFSTWLYQICRNLCINELKRRKRHPSAPLEEMFIPEKGAMPKSFDVLDKKLEKDELCLQVMEIINSLPEIYREVLIMHIFQEIPYKEIASIIRCREGTARMRLHYALEKLRESIPVRSS